MEPQLDTTLPPPPPKSRRKTWIIIGIVLAVLVICVCVVAVIVGVVVGYPYLQQHGLVGSSPVGTWATTYDWGCTGSGQSSHFFVQNNGTFTDDDSSTGAWVLTGNQVTFTYSSGTAYTGTLAQDAMSGTMVSYDGRTGCWNSTRTGP
jgi:ABC-type Fe3+ transport system permease subunit